MPLRGRAHLDYIHVYGFGARYVLHILTYIRRPGGGMVCVWVGGHKKTNKQKPTDITSMDPHGQLEDRYAMFPP